MEIDPGFNINANRASIDYLIPTTLNVTISCRSASSTVRRFV